MTEPFEQEEQPFPLARDLQLAQAIGKVNRSLESIDERLDALETETRLTRREVAQLSGFLHDSLLSGDLAPAPKTEPVARRSVPAQVACVGKYSAVAIGVLGLVVQVASIWRPDLQGPLTELLHLFGG